MSVQERNRRVLKNLEKQIEKVNLNVFDKKSEAIENAKAMFILCQGNLNENEKESIEDLLCNVCEGDDPVTFVWYLAVGASLQLKGVKKKQYQEWVEKQHPDLQPYLLELPPSQYIEEPSGCYITTATCSSLQKGDNCYELEKFRWFRDNWLINQEGGEELVNQYYKVAPNIVENINHHPDKMHIYGDIWSAYLKFCLRSIESGNFETCKDIYIKMVDRLQILFAK